MKSVITRTQLETYRLLLRIVYNITDNHTKAHFFTNNAENSAKNSILIQRLEVSKTICLRRLAGVKSKQTSMIKQDAQNLETYPFIPCWP